MEKYHYIIAEKSSCHVFRMGQVFYVSAPREILKSKVFERFVKNKPELKNIVTEICQISEESFLKAKITYEVQK
ncbi:MAG TPA: hypothetical protein VMV36_01580 [Ignavibacteriaceae bacterium]|nr:hypothetical protein [Ignavibacteriaceae bacterium]